MTSAASARSATGPRLALVAFQPLGKIDGGFAVRAARTADALRALGVLELVMCLADESTRGDDAATNDERRGVDEVRVARSRAWPWRLRHAARALGTRVDGYVVESALLGAPLLGLGRRLIWDTNECETLHYLRRRHGFGDVARGTVWFVLEALMSIAATAVVAISTEEAAHWRRLFPWVGRKVMVCDHLPILGGASVGGSSRPARQARAASSDTDAEPQRRCVLFMGNLGAKHNDDAARWCIDVLLPTLAEDVELVLVGPGTDRLVEELGAPARARGLGYVENVDDMLRAATLTIAPLAAGAGVKTKVVHALALGQRVVGTPYAFEGLGEPPGAVIASLEVLPTVLRSLLAEPEPAAHAAARKQAQAQWSAELLDEGRLRLQWAAVLGAVTSDGARRSAPRFRSRRRLAR